MMMEIQRVKFARDGTAREELSEVVEAGGDAKDY